MKKEIKSGIIFSLTSLVVFGLAGIVYASTVSSGQLLTADLFNEKMVPSTAVMAFANDGCPNGWSEYLPAQGRFIRGIDKTGTYIDPIGQRSVGDIKEDTFKNHNHYRQDDHENDFTYQDDKSSVISSAASQGDVSDRGKWEGYTGDSPTGESETSPKNVALLYCIKN